ncbi:MAG TPA: YcaO-like family protein, partial [Ramlibacter sp.]
PLGAGALATILWAAHGVTAAGASSATGPRRTVASASRMHGTRWFVFVLRPQPGEAGTEPLSPGLHEARFHLEGGCSFERLTPGADAAWELLVDPRVLTYASALVLPVHDASLPARRYGNRAPLFGALEAGQSLQNAQLMAEALEAAAVVRGDLRGELALRLVQPYLRPEKGEGARCIALPALVLGARALPRDAELARGERWVSVRAAPRVAGAGSFAFSAGPVRVGTEEFHASGRSSDPRLALVKAEAEAWERHGWGTLGACTEARVGELDQVVDPCRIVAYARHQYAAAGFPLAPFSRRSPYLWRQGMDVQSGREVWLLADCVHALGALPREHRAKAYTNTSTSGVAAWTDAEGALCRGALELLERDAFLRVWVGRRPPILTDPASLPAAARARIDGLAAAGHRVAVAQVADDFVPVYTVFLQAQARAFTAVTAAAAFDPEQALAKALDEAEGRAAHALAAPAEPLASARRVHSLSDIDRFYQSPRFFRNADFLAAGPATESFAVAQHPFCRDWEALKLRLAARALQLIAVDLTPPGAAIRQGRVPLHVVRAVVPGLLPIWFHHGVHPGGMPAFRAARRVAGTRMRAAAHLVHPFT